jgi:hypothetical protein
MTNLWTVGIVTSSGSQAFNPNPTIAAMGDILHWTNNDVLPHRLVIDDGTLSGQLIGIINPGETSQPITLNMAYTTYHCTYHPSMVGTLGNLPAGAPAPPSATPAPPSGYVPPPPDYTPPPPDNYGYRVR